MAAMTNRLRNYFFPKVWSHTDENRTKIEWVIRLRWIALFAQSVSMIPALELGYLETQFFFSFMVTLIFLIAFNILISKFLKLKIKITETDLLFQLSMDVAVLTILLMLTGGAWNPLCPLLFFHAGLGALLLKKVRGFVFFFFILISLTILQRVPTLPPALRVGPTPRAILFFSDLIVALVTWRLTAWLSETLDSLSLNVKILQDRKVRMDRLRAIGALASGLSHEFATPLNTIKIRLERIKRSSPAQSPDLIAALDAVEQCEKALRSMNDNRIQADCFSLTPVHLKKTVAEVVTSWKKNHMHVELEYCDQLEHSDALALPKATFSQVILNLLDNALESGAEKLKLKIHFLEENGFICLRIHDNGNGISDIVFRQWGEPFVTTKSDGTGLGLFNALSLAQALGGEFRVYNRPEESGACAEFCLPPCVGSLIEPILASPDAY